MAEHKWSQDLTEHSNAFDLEDGVFTKDDFGKITQLLTLFDKG